MAARFGTSRAEPDAPNGQSFDVSHRTLFRQAGAHEKLVAMLRADEVWPQRMATMALANFATSIRCQKRLLDAEVLDPILTLAKKSLDPKAKGDGETERYAMLCISNLAAQQVRGPRTIYEGS